MLPSLERYPEALDGVDRLPTLVDELLSGVLFR